MKCSLNVLITDHECSTTEGNVFTGVSHSVWGGEGGVGGCCGPMVLQAWGVGGTLRL